MHTYLFIYILIYTYNAGIVATALLTCGGGYSGGDSARDWESGGGRQFATSAFYDTHSVPN